MEHRRADPDQRHRCQNRTETGRDSEQENAGNATGHACGQREIDRAAVRIQAHQGLQQRGDQLANERDQTDLAKVQAVSRFEDGIDGGDEGLQDIVEQVRYADRGKNASGDLRNFTLSWGWRGAGDA